MVSYKIRKKQVLVHKVNNCFDKLLLLKRIALDRQLEHKEVIRLNDNFKERLLDYLEQEKIKVIGLNEPIILNNIENNISIVETYIE
jgi:3'-phosphoadenosine 5'-phosphosulfate sulfotransferase (PAPS reductase)/FAD synthetase